MEISSEDVFLASFPKSGTTWLLNIVFNVTGEDQKHDNVDDIIPWLDCDPFSIGPSGPKRYFKSHVPFSWLPHNEGPKYIYIARNPKDVAISFYYFLRNMQDQVIGYKKENEVDIPAFIDLFVEGNVLYGSWWDHVMSWYNASLVHENVLFITYEQLSGDAIGMTRKIGRFLGRELDDDKVGAITSKCSFNSMKKDDKSSMSYLKDFWRKGICGDYVNFFTDEQIRKFDEKTTGMIPDELRNMFNYT